MDKGTRTYDIPTAEYEKSRHVFDLWRWINSTMAEMQTLNCFDSIYFERKGRNVKKFIEEAIPIARLGLSFVRPMQDVHIQCLTGNQPYDGTLVVNGYKNLNISIEVTTAEDTDAHLRRQSLARNGFVYGNGPISRDRSDRRKIVSTAEMADVEDAQRSMIDLALGAATRKINSGAYDQRTAILVRLNPCFAWEMSYRKELERRTKSLLREREGAVFGIYYYCENGNVLDTILSKI